jgi:hypothetical protein
MALKTLELRLNERDKILKQYGAALAALGKGGANRIMTMALNKEGDRGRTQVRKALREQTGIQSHQIRSVMRTYRASAGNLVYELDARARETNIAQFHMTVRWRKLTKGKWKGSKAQVVSAAPWNKRRTFPGSFRVEIYKGRAYKRTDKGRGPLKPLYGPNIAREMQKAQSREAWQQVPKKLSKEVGRLLGLVTSGALKLGGRGYRG